MTLRKVFEDTASRRPAAIALRYHREQAWQSRTYEALMLGVRQMAEAFGRLGLKPVTERVALMLENGPEWIESYLATSGAGVAASRTEHAPCSSANRIVPRTSHEPPISMSSRVVWPDVRRTVVLRWFQPSPHPKNQTV